MPEWRPLRGPPSGLARPLTGPSPTPNSLATHPSACGRYAARQAPSWGRCGGKTFPNALAKPGRAGRLYLTDAVYHPKRHNASRFPFFLFRLHYADPVIYLAMRQEDIDPTDRVQNDIEFGLNFPEASLRIGSRVRYKGTDDIGTIVGIYLTSDPFLVQWDTDSVGGDPPADFFRSDQLEQA